MIIGLQKDEKKKLGRPSAKKSARSSVFATMNKDVGVINDLSKLN